MKKKFPKSIQTKNNAPYQHSLQPNLSLKPPLTQTSSYKTKTSAKSPQEPQSLISVYKQESLKHIDMDMKESADFPISKINLITPENMNICLLKPKSGPSEVSHPNNYSEEPYGTFRDFENDNNKDNISKEPLREIIFKSEIFSKITINNTETESKSSLKKAISPMLISPTLRKSLLKPNYLNRFESYGNKSVNLNESKILKLAASNPGSKPSSNESTPRASPTSRKSLKKNTNAGKRRGTVFPENNKGFFGQSNVLKLFKIDSHNMKGSGKKEMSLNLKFNLDLFFLYKI